MSKLNNPLVSIIMPAYNAGKYLKRSIESVLNQTYKNFEFIIVDDGSTDASFSIYDSYCEKDSRIKIIFNQHGGTACARNTALNVAIGEYIAFLDADDAYHPKYLETMLNAAETTGAQISLCATVRDITIDEFYSLNNKAEFEKISVEEAFGLMYGGNWPDMIAPYTKLYRKCIFDNLRFPDGQYFEDASTMNLAIYNSNYLCITNETLYFYNVTPNSSSVTKRSIELLDREKALRSHWEFFFNEDREDLAYLAIPFYLIEMITTYFRVLESDKPEDSEFIRNHFEDTYKRYKSKILLSKQQKEKILGFRKPILYDIRNMIKTDGFFKTLFGFVKRKLG